jgi:hypothetical protein
LPNEVSGLSSAVDGALTFSSEDEYILANGELNCSLPLPLDRMLEDHDELEEMEEDREREVRGGVSETTERGEAVNTDLLESSRLVSAGRRRDLKDGSASH